MISKYTNRISVNSPLQFYVDKVVAELIGFNTSYLRPNDINKYYMNLKTIVGETTSKPRTVDVIEIHCNTVDHSFVQHYIHEQTT